MRRVNYYLTQLQVERIDAHSLRTGLDRSAIIRLAVDAYLEKAEKAKGVGR